MIQRFPLPLQPLPLLPSSTQPKLIPLLPSSQTRLTPSSPRNRVRGVSAPRFTQSRCGHTPNSVRPFPIMEGIASDIIRSQIPDYGQAYPRSRFRFMKRRIPNLLCLFAVVLVAVPCATAQVVPSEELQAQMLIEEQAFLKGMKPGLQHEQMLAVREAVRGNVAPLEQIRASRISVSLPRRRLRRVGDPSCSIFMAGVGASGASIVAHGFVLLWRWRRIVASSRSTTASPPPFPSPLRSRIAGTPSNSSRRTPRRGDTTRSESPSGATVLGATLPLLLRCPRRASGRLSPFTPLRSFSPSARHRGRSMLLAMATTPSFWKLLMKRMPEGRRATLYAPSRWRRMRRSRHCLLRLFSLPGTTSSSIRVPSWRNVYNV